MSIARWWRTRPVWHEWRSALWHEQCVGLTAEQIMAQPVTDDFHAKQGRSTGRWRVGNESSHVGAVYLKRHYRLPLRTRLLAWLWPTQGWSPGWSEFMHLRWADAAGIPVPEVLAAGERVGPGLHLQSYLVLRELAGQLPLHEAIPLAAETLPQMQFLRWKRALVTELARLCRLLHQRGRYHRDLYLCHFFVPRASISTAAVAPGSVTLIDFHRLRHGRWLGFRWQIKDLAELLYSSQLPGVSARDRLRFFRMYRGRRRLTFWERGLASWVRGKAARYTRHNWDEVRRLNAAKPRARPELSGATP